MIKKHIGKSYECKFTQMSNCHRVRIAIGMIDQLHLEAIHCFGIQVDLEDKSRNCSSLYFHFFDKLFDPYIALLNHPDLISSTIL